jgi:ribosomal 50S subunit-recycling heat shock protein
MTKDILNEQRGRFELTGGITQNQLKPIEIVSKTDRIVLSQNNKSIEVEIRKLGEFFEKIRQVLKDPDMSDPRKKK